MDQYRAYITRRVVIEQHAVVLINGNSDVSACQDAIKTVSEDDWNSDGKTAQGLAVAHIAKITRGN